MFLLKHNETDAVILLHLEKKMMIRNFIEMLDEFVISKK